MNIDMQVSSKVDPYLFIESAINSGVNAIVVVGRDYSDTLQFQIRGREQGFLVLGGVQYGCRDQGSLLVYGVSDGSLFSESLSLQDMVGKVNKCGGAAVLCQPISESLYGSNFRLNFSGVAAVQTLNARLNYDNDLNNELAVRVAEAS